MTLYLNYIITLLFFVLCLILAGVLLLLTYILSPKTPDLEKISPYECGFESFSSSRILFDLHFYIVAILFLLFDVEIAFLVPWALNLSQLNAAGYLSMLIFFGLLIIGFIYEWLNGSLDWTNKKLI